MLIPTGEAVYEKVPANQFHPPTVVEMLRAQHLTGYARFSFADSTVILVFVEGRVVEAVTHESAGGKLGDEAVAHLFDRLANEASTLDVYRLSPALAGCVRALLRGEVMLKGQAMGFLNVKGLLQQLKEQKLTACLRVYTDDRSALIFYANGSPLGFFHDGSKGIETTADVSQSVARLPGARLDVLTLVDGVDQAAGDLCADLDLGQIWKDATNRRALEQSRRARERDEDLRRQRAAGQQRLAADVRQALVAHLGEVGKQVFEKVAADRLARPGLRPAQAEELLAALETAAKLLVGGSQSRRLVQAVRERLEAGVEPSA